MELVTKTGKNIQVGEVIAICDSSEAGRKYPVGKSRIDETLSFVEIISLGEIRKGAMGVKYMDIYCADENTYTLEMSNHRYAIKIK
jgi:hypothetical protein